MRYLLDAALDGRLPNNDQLFSTLFNSCDELVRLEDNRITREASSNVHGDWYEWLLAISAWNHFVTNPASHLAILLPNIVQFDVGSLYSTRLNNLIIDLKKKVAEGSGVQLITSNPDFVIIHRDLARGVLVSDSSSSKF